MQIQSYILLACVGGRVRSVGARVGSGGLHVGSGCLRVGSARLFRHQHVGIINTNCSLLGVDPTRSPNASAFALQWYIGFSPMSMGIKIWDALAIELQCATTKVKFKQALKPLCQLTVVDLNGTWTE